MKSLEFSWKDSAGLEIYANEWRPDQDARGVIALVHGIGEHLHRYDAMAEFYNQSGYAMIAFDLPGHGRSGGIRGDFSFDRVMENIDRLIAEARQRYPGKPFFLYGHSLGGSLVLYYCIKRKPELNGIVAASPSLGLSAPVPWWKSLTARLLIGIFPSLTMPSGLDVSYLSRDPDVAKKYLSDPLVHNKVSIQLGLDIMNCGPRIMEHIGEITRPLLLLQGMSDRIADPSATVKFAEKAGNNVRFIRFEKYYHELHNEPEKAGVFKTVIGWLDSRL